MANYLIYDNWLKKDDQSPDIYYGYSYDADALDGDAKWSIKKVTTVGQSEIVTWANGGDGVASSSIWDNRYDYFTASALPLNLSATEVDHGSYISLRISWDLIDGVDRYQVIIAGSASEVFTNDGYIVYNNGYNSVATMDVFNNNEYIYKKVEVGESYNVTVTGFNVAANITESIAVNIIVPTTTTTTTAAPTTTTTTTTP